MKLNISLKWKIVIPGVFLAGVLLLINIGISYRDVKLLYIKTLKSSSESLVKITSKRLEEQFGSIGFDNSALSIATLDLKRIAESSTQFTDIMLIDDEGTIAAHNIPTKIGIKLSEKEFEIVKKVGTKAEIVKLDDFYYTIIPAFIIDAKPRAYFMLGSPAEKISQLVIKTISKQFLLFLLYVLLLTLLGTLFIQRFIIYPVEQLLKHTKQVESGDLSHDAEQTTLDEIGSFTSAYNSTVKKLRNMIVTLRDIASDISTSSENISFKYAKIKRDFDVQTHLLVESVKSVDSLVQQIREINEKAESLNTTSQDATESMSQLGNAIQNIEENIKFLYSALSNISSAVEQIASSINEVAKNTQALAKDSEEMASSINEIHYSLKEVTRNSEEGLKIAEKTNAFANMVMEKTEQTVKGMATISSSIDELQGIINQLGIRSTQIGDILTVINSIAEQTNLLALNAAIIASQAGEYGKGFQVVANEIRNLAERTSASTAEIDNLIKTAQSDVKRAVEAVDRGKTNVDEGKIFAYETKDAISKLTESTEKVLSAITAITKATKEQLFGSSIITEAASRTSDNTNKIATAVSEQAKGVNHIRVNLEKISQLAQDIYRAITEQVKISQKLSRISGDISLAHRKVSDATANQFKESSAIHDSLKKALELLKETLNTVADIHDITDSFVEKTEDLDSRLKQFKLAKQ